MIGRRANASRQLSKGFTLTEVLVATLVLIVCLVAIAQLVPAAILSNSANRNDSTAAVFAQQEMNQLVSQPLSQLQYTTDTSIFMCTVATPCQLGDPTQSNQAVGNLVTMVNGYPVIDFSNGTPVAGYSFVYHDPNDPTETVYDVRWMVITKASGANVSSKRFILGVVKRGGNGFNLPVTLDTLVSQ
jgi:type II secretory pathway pseudopilin PulG